MTYKPHAPFASRPEGMPRRRFFRKATLYAKVAVAVAAGTWLAFQPLVSSAQGKAPQQTVAPSPSGSVPVGGKAISFSDAQKMHCAAQEGKTQAPEQQKFDSTHPYAGVKRILVELADQPDSAQFYARTYALLVDEIAAALLSSTGASCEENRQRMAMLWEIMQSRFSFANDTRFLSSSLANGIWDCDASAIFAHDVLKLLGEESRYFPLAGHGLLAVGALAFETKTGAIYESDSIPYYYSSEARPVSCDSAALSLAYLELGNADLDAGRHESAIANYRQAIALDFNDPNAHNNLGLAYSACGLQGMALKEFTIAIGISPKRGIARLNRANLYEKLGRQAEADADREAYYGVKGVKVISQ